MPDNLRSDLDKFHEEAAKRPVFDFSGKNQPAKEITQVISQNKQPESHTIWDETFAWEPGPVQSILAFFYPLLGSASTIVKMNYTLWLGTHVGYYEARPWE